MSESDDTLAATARLTAPLPSIDIVIALSAMGWAIGSLGDAVKALRKGDAVAADAQLEDYSLAFSSMAKGLARMTDLMGLTKDGEPNVE